MGLDFSRQVAVPEVGLSGQERLSKSRALVVGAGGTGSPVIMYLASAGLRRVDVVDSDVVEPSNLHRQILHARLGEWKALSASGWIRSRESWSEYSTSKFENLEDVQFISGAQIPSYDVILDCTDRWSSHRDVIMAGMGAGIPVVHGSIAGLMGRVMTFAKGTACWLCLHPEKPSGTAGLPRGTVGPVCGIVGSAMAMEAMKLILGMPAQTPGHMLAFDATSMRFHMMRVTPLEGCPGCKGLSDA